ncbi:MAG: DNA repair protein RecN [Bacteroidales bacterium]|jgi:DNA repair protein RecN (Recombination protein N)|nr:DNA repair protein RecN [Bacteroidales bacterium]
MLSSLKIENYALINKTEIDFPDGFIVITGETGAGKSIMLGALGLVLGQRADTNVLQDKEKRCIVEAEFSLDNSFIPFFEKNDLDFDANSIFRREIMPNGKSRAFINDVPVQLSVLKTIGDVLMDIHSQHTTLTLKGSEFQRLIIDNYLDNISLLTNYKTTYKEWKTLQIETEKLEEKYRNFVKEQSYFQYLLEEFENVKLKENEQEELEKEIELMSNSEEIKNQITQSLQLFDGEDYGNVLFNLSQIKNNISKIASYDKDLTDILQRLESSIIELKDIVTELFSFNDNIIFNQQTLDTANERLDIIYGLERKHNVNTIAQLLSIRKDIENKLSSNEDLEILIKQKKNAISTLFSTLSNQAQLLSEHRKQVANRIEKEVIPLLSDMGMANACLKIVIESNYNNYMINGIDDIDFLFSANKGSELKPLAKVASGGELSRLMLALKAVLARKSQMPTIIFDEIDSGVSGDIAAKVGNIIKQMSENHQLIVITHLPQMAAKATNHYKVFKEEEAQTTISKIKHLTQAERVGEIATMLSNDSITQAAINNAKELLS